MKAHSRTKMMSKNAVVAAMLAVSIQAGGLFATGAPAWAEDANPAAVPPDPIAAQLSADPSKSPPVMIAPLRSFSPKAISDLLKTGNGPAAPAASSTDGQSGAINKADIKTEDARPLPSMESINATTYARVDAGARTVDPVVLKAEILLDRAHAPPGVIDGRYGSNFVKAIRTFEEVRGLEVDGKLTRRVWDELRGDDAAPVLGRYTITADDVKGPFYPDLSADYADQAKLKDLGYRSPDEMFGERFHMDKKFLRALNPGVDMSVPGSAIIVAQVEAMPIAAKIKRIDVDKSKGQVLAYDADGMLVVAYPATIGSEELPSPSGSYVVRGVAPHPTYTYDPKKNFQQGNNTQKLILPPGPNNPVGIAFIALSKPTYGIHGTPDPSKIDKTHSHGCVRLTNWNAQELSKLASVGTPVNFLDKPAPDQASVSTDSASH